MEERINYDSRGSSNNELISSAKIFGQRHSRKKEKILYVYTFIEIEKPPAKAICMISKTLLDEKGKTLQCPNCENYFLSEYLLGWLKNNHKCPICQTKLKIKKI